MSLEFFDSMAVSGQDSRMNQLVVQLTQERNSWVGLPPALVSRLVRAGAALPLVLELRPLMQRAGLSMPGPIAAHVAWSGSGSAAGCIGIPAGLAGVLHLQEGSTVAVQATGGVPTASSVTVEPASEDDWEVVELNAEYLEQQLLSQVGVVGAEQPLVLWVRGHLITLKVTAMVPAAMAARLAPGTEVYVAPRLRVGSSLPALAANGSLAGPGATGKSGSNGHANEASQAGNSSSSPAEVVLRVQQLSERATSGSSASSSAVVPSAAPVPAKVKPVYVAPATLARTGLAAGDWVRVSGRISSSLANFGCLVPSELVALGHLGLTPALCESFGLEPCSQVRLQQLTQSQVDLLLEADQHLAAARAAMANGTSHASINGSSKPVSPQEQGDDQAAAGLQAAADPQAAEDGRAADILLASWLQKPAEQALRYLLPVLGSSPRSLLQSWGVPRPGGLLIAGPPGSGKTALSALLAAVLGRHSECLTYTVVVSCREVSAEGTNQAKAQLIPKIQEALSHMPALLVLDDLDVLCPAEAPSADGSSSGADPALVAWLSDVLDYLAAPSSEWGALQAGGSSGNTGGGEADGEGALPDHAATVKLWPPVAVAATCKDAAEVAAPLRSAGRLDHTVTLPAPSANSRAAMLQAGLRSRGAAAAPQHVHAVAKHADGFDAADLEVLLDRAMHQALRRQLTSHSSTTSDQQLQQEQQQGASQGSHMRPGSSSHPQQDRQPAIRSGLQLAAPKRGPGIVLEEGDLQQALEGMTPAAFWGVGTQQGLQRGVEGWQDVGGLDDVRQALHEALELPLRYASLVATAPLRLRTGVLLYGPPGCGKTHVVAAAVAAARVRCITVAGPELLNKYIGASEAGVRDVFQRAAAAAPCVLFFDEFDAIAPQRGHDNTGVTDRVVNQLLTELDGVEGLKGVCVIGATSRPDLIDAALLRPGRLDRLLYCGFPTPTERGRIMAALARNLHLAPDVELQQLAYEADDLSGADLSAVLAEAQLAAVHEALESGGPGGTAAQSGSSTAAQAGPHVGRGAHAPPVVQQRHLAAALAAARPSLAHAERQRLEAIYQRFQQGREGGLDNSSAVSDKGKGKMVSWA